MYSGKKRIISSLLVSLGVLFSNSCSFAGKKRLSVGSNYVRVKGSRFNRVPKPIPNLKIGNIRRGRYSLRKRSKSSSNVPLYLLGTAGVIAFAGGTYLVCSDSGERPKKIEDKEKGDSGKGGKPATPGKKSGTKNCGPYKPKESNWELYYRKKISDSGTILRIYHGNIIQIGRDEDIFRDHEVSNEDTIVVSTDNYSLSPGDTIAAEMASAANDRRYSGSYQYPDDASCREQIKKLGEDWGITGILGKAGGYLKVGNIFHIVAPGSTGKNRDKNFKQVYVNCILSHKKGGGRVVIPPLGDGNFGNSTEDTAKFFAEALEEVFKKPHCGCGLPKYVDLVILSNSNYDYDKCKCNKCNKKVCKYEIFVNAVSEVFGKSEEIK